MKKFFYFLLTITFLSSCTGQQSADGQKSVTNEFRIENNYLLIPVQESCQDIKATITVPETGFSQVLWFRVAKDSVDYWVKYDVSKFKNKKLTFKFESADDRSFGINKMHQSDKFEFEYNEKYRPKFHFTPEFGWTNDPNGMVYLDGEYHLFFQHNPYGNKWGNMHWGHAVSTDLMSWTYLPDAIAPDTLGDIFSGSSVVDSANTAGFGKNAIVAIYTNNGKKQVQSIAYSTDKGRTFTKYKGNPVIPNPGIVDFRDPKVHWNKISNQWVLTMATQQTITFYGSPDLKHWTRLSEFGQGIGSHSGVWECPDLFPMQYEGKEKWVLLVSINPGGPNHGSATQYFIGNFDGKTFTPDNLPYPLWVDYGRDDYAGVTFSNIPESDGRRIFIGWMSNWDYANDVPTKYFRSAMTLPRELTLVKNGSYPVLASFPVKEFNKITELKKSVPVLNFNENSVEIPADGTFALKMNFTPNTSANSAIALTNDKNESIDFNFDYKTGTFNLNRTYSGLTNFNSGFELGMGVQTKIQKSYELYLVVDKASVELFINQGQYVLTSIYFSTSPLQRLKVTQNASLNNIEIYNIK